MTDYFDSPGSGRIRDYDDTDTRCTVCDGTGWRELPDRTVTRCERCARRRHPSSGR